MGGVCCAKEIPLEDGKATVVSTTSATSSTRKQLNSEALDLLDADWILVKPGAQYKQRSTDIRQLACMRKPGEIVRGRRDGDWLVMADDGGFMPFVGTKSGEPLFQRHVADAATPSTNSGNDEDTPASSADYTQESMRDAAAAMTNLHDTMCIKNLRDDLDSGAFVEQNMCSGLTPYIDLSYNSTWRVVYPMQFPVHSDMTIQATFVGSKKPGDVIRGRRMGDFVAIEDGQGFMRVIAAITGKVVLEEVQEHSPTNGLGPSQNWEAFERQWEFPEEGDQQSEADAATIGTQDDQAPITRKELESDQSQNESANGSFVATLDAAGPDASNLGVKVSPVQINGVDVGLVIKAIRPGLITRWNDQNPSQQILVGDVIGDVNGSHAYSHDLFGMITQGMEAKNTLKLVIVRDRSR